MRSRLTAFTLVATLAAGLTAALALPPTAARADHHEETVATTDVLVLRDGRRIEGEIVGRDERFVSIRAAGVLRAYPTAEVTEVLDRGPKAGSAESTADVPLPAPESATASDAPKKKRKGDRASAKARGKKKGAPADSEAGTGEMTGTGENAGTGDRPDRGRRDVVDAAPLSPEAQRWLASLLDRALASESPDPAVAESIGAALRALGPAAAPEIERTARGAEGPVAERLIALAAKMRSAGRGRVTSDRPPTDGPLTDGPATDRAASDRAASDRVGRTRPGDLIGELGLDRQQGRALREALAAPVREARRIVAEARTSGTPREDVRADLEPIRAQIAEAVRGVIGEERAQEIGPERLGRLFQSLVAPGRAKREGREGREGQKKPAPVDPGID